jgi:GAF domain-containing protein
MRSGWRGRLWSSPTRWYATMTWWSSCPGCANDRSRSWRSRPRVPLLTDGDKRLQVVAVSTETVTVLETLQIQRQEGPCVDAYRSGRRVAVPDLRRVGRHWPVFTPRALGAGVCAFPMRLRAERIGALNIFQATPGEFDQAAVLAGQALADVATIAILQARAVEDAARLAEQLEYALESRVVVEQAKGILAERLGIDPEVAFTRLRRHGRQHGLHLATLARQVVGGSFPLDEETGQEG